MTLSTTAREKVIEMARQNKGRNRIAHELGIGQGTVSAILKKWRETYSNPAPATILTPQSQASVCIDACQQHEAICQNHVPTNPNSSSIQRPKPRNGNPLSYLIVEDNPNPPQNKTKNLEVNIHNNEKYLHNQYEAIKEEKQSQHRTLLSDPSYPSRCSEDNPGKEDQDQEEEPVDLGIDWNRRSPRYESRSSIRYYKTRDSESENSITSDIDETWQSEFWGRAMQEKELRRQEIEWILEEKQENIQMRERLEEQKNNLKNREAKVAEVESLAPSLRQLQQMGVDFSLMQSYILLVNERSVLGNIDNRQAALFLSSEFRELGNLGKILKKKQEAEQELSMFGEQKQKALTVLMSLIDKGITESQIALFATDYWQQSQQSNGNIQQPLDNNGYGDGNLSISDYIRFNLLKGATTNALDNI